MNPFRKKHTYKILFVLIGLAFIANPVRRYFDPNYQYQKYQDFNSTSPSGCISILDYIEFEELHYWRIRIFDKGTLKFVDDRSFPARFNIYWLWDDFNRFWVRDTDSGNLYYITAKNGVFIKTMWDPNTPIQPPLVLKSNRFRTWN